MRFACPAWRSHNPSSSMATSCALRNRCLDMRCPDRLRRSAKPAASSGSNRTTASAASAPFLVAPNESACTPARHVAAAGEQPSCAIALARRAPSMCRRRPWPWVTSARAAICGGVDGAPLGGLGDADRRAAVGGFRQQVRRELPSLTGQPDQPGATGEELGRAILLDQDMRRLVAVDRAAGAGQRRQGQTVGGRARRDREDREVGREHLARQGGEPCVISSSP